MYLVSPGEDEGPDVAAVEVLGAVEQHAVRSHGHRGYLQGAKYTVDLIAQIPF